MVENYLNDLEGEEIWCCDFFATRMNLQEPYLSLCHDAFVGQRKIGYLDGYTPEKYYSALREIASDNESPDSHCRHCQKCQHQMFHFRKLNWITINTSWYCNSSCIYCMGHFASLEDGKDVLGIIEQFHNDGLFDENCLFDWGGGEPTLNPIFDTTVRWIINHNYAQRINTNGILYSEAVEQALKSNRTSLRLSIDSGTEECFERIKGTKHYSDVWRNIEKYRKYSEKIFIKYNVFNLNCEKKEIDVFLDKCDKTGIKHIIIDSEVKSYQPDLNCGPLYYTREAFDAMHYLYDQAISKNMDVEISDYAFSYRPEYENGALKLPSRYYDNIDRTVISNDIYLQTKATVDQLIDVLKNSGKKIIIRGYGAEGKKLVKILRENNLEIAYIVDLNMPETNVDDMRFRTLKAFFGDMDKSNVVLAGHCWKEMLKEINDNKKVNFDVFYMNGLYYEEYLKGNCDE